MAEYILDDNELKQCYQALRSRLEVGKAAGSKVSAGLLIALDRIVMSHEALQEANEQLRTQRDWLAEQCAQYATDGNEIAKWEKQWWIDTIGKF